MKEKSTEVHKEAIARRVKLQIQNLSGESYTFRAAARLRGSKSGTQAPVVLFFQDSQFVICFVQDPSLLLSFLSSFLSFVALTRLARLGFSQVSPSSSAPHFFPTPRIFHPHADFNSSKFSFFSLMFLRKSSLMRAAFHSDLTAGVKGDIMYSKELSGLIRFRHDTDKRRDFKNSSKKAE